MRASMTWVKTAAVAAAMSILSSCAFVDNTTGIVEPTTPARFSVSANIRAATATQVALAAVYMRHGRTVDDGVEIDDPDLVFLSLQLFDLKPVAGQQVIPFTVNVGPCLSDPDVARTGSACPVTIVAILLKGQNTIAANPKDTDFGDNDLAFAFSPVQATPGENITLSQPMELHEVDQIKVQPSGVTVQAGNSVTLSVTAFDAAGTPINSTTDIGFNSSNPSIAVVTSPGGVVTGTGVGSATITVSVGRHTTTVPVTVAPPAKIVLPADTTARFSATQGTSGSGFASFAVTSSTAPAQVNLAAPQVTFSGGASGWLTASVSASQTPATLTLTLGNTASLASGTYSAFVSVRSTNTLIAARTIVVSLTVSSNFSVAVTKTGNGGGTVTASPAGPLYTPGTVVTLTATPDAGSTFGGWSGDCSGTASCTLTMNANKSVQATFSKPASGTSRTSLTAVRGSCSWDVVINSTLTMPAIPSSGPVSGTAHLVGIDTIATSIAGCNPEVDPMDASFQLSGTPSNITFSGVALGANDGVSNFISVSFSGAVGANGQISGTLTFTYSGPGASGSGSSPVTVK